MDCARHCRAMAESTYDLADRAEHPEALGDFLAIATKYVRCAEHAERLEAGATGATRTRRDDHDG